MSALTVSAELAASVQRMRARTELDGNALLYEQGLKPTRPAIRACLPKKGLVSRFLPRQRSRLSDPQRKAARERRRVLGGSAVLPPNLRCCYTLGQMAVLCIMAGEVKHHGICDLPIEKIRSALAGVCRTTVQTTLHEARRLFLIKITERPQPGRKNLTNIVQITSAEWLTWIKRGPTAHRPIGSNSVKIVSTTKITDLINSAAARVERLKGAVRGVPWARSRRTYEVLRR